MKSRNQAGRVWLASTAALLIMAGVSPSWGAAANTPSEAKCQATMTKSIGKQAAAVTNAMAKCADSVFAGAPGPCPDASAQAAIDKASAKALKLAKKCQSKCAISAVPCIGSPACPPNGTGSEACSDAGKNIFEFNNMGFPGAFCNSIIDHDMFEPDDFGVCAAGMGDLVSASLMENIYGGLTGSPALSSTAAKCLASIAKSAPKSASKAADTVAKCRAAQLSSETPAVLVDDCPTADSKTAEGLAKIYTKFTEGIASKCTDADILELDLCGAGVGGTLNVAAAQVCLSEMLEQASTSVAAAESREYAPVSIINGAYPDTAAPLCGDNLVNQLANQFLLNGEECDGTDDSDCPGECLPPGDIFECTCGNIRRSRSFADAFAADLDNGWAGPSHNARVTDEAGFVADVSGCDCSAFDPLNPSTCIGASSDPVCNVFAELKPRCSNSLDSGLTCDQSGNNNNANNNTDCRSCDEFSGNSGDYCTGAARYCVGGANTGDRCAYATDCPGGACNGIGACLGGSFAGNGCAGVQDCGLCTGGGNNGGTCSLPAHCPGGTCAPAACASKSCTTGANYGNPCATNGDCGGDRCGDTSDCLAQCYDGDNVATGPCAAQEDCADGEICRGRCDSTNYCLVLRNGAPLPLSSEGTSVCIDSQFHTNMTGTRDIVTGAHAINYELRSVTILANDINSRPCPVCGGYCAPGGPNPSLNYFRCDGSCTGPELECRSGKNIGDTCTTNVDCNGSPCDEVRCRFDDDCPSGTCTDVASPECGGGTCRLDLSCAGGSNHGSACRLEAYTAFGTTSADCPANISTNVSGAGLAISWTPLTSGVVTLEQPGACDADGYQNYDCNCTSNPIGRPGTDGTRTQPNRCLPACTAPTDSALEGRRCASFTVCVGGAENGAACDETSDCSGGGTCTGNPKVCGVGNAGVCSVSQCVGGGNNGGFCTSGTQCPGGACVTDACVVGGAPCTDGACLAPSCTVDANCDPAVTCDDVCPGGLCTPLCMDRGLCTGGLRDGQRCALDTDCTGGGLCGPGDEYEGACAQGSFNHCDGPGWEFVSCAPLQVGTQEGCEMGTDNVLGNTNDQIGAGTCVADITNCFVNDGLAEGGTTLNGNGDPTNGFSVATYCIPASTSSAVNSTAGLPGPGRIRQPSLSIPNYTVLP